MHLFLLIWVSKYICLASTVRYSKDNISKPVTHLEVLSYFVEGDVDGEGRGVVVRSERALSVRAVFHNKVQQSIALQQNTVRLQAVTCQVTYRILGILFKAELK